MKRITTLLAVMLLAISMTATAALADHDPNPHPAQNATQCGNVNGVFTQPDGASGVNVCVVTVAGSTSTVAASHSSGTWTVDVATDDTVHTYTSLGSTRTHTTTGGGVGAVSACYNGQGNAVGGYATNPNCLPA